MSTKLDSELMGPGSRLRLAREQAKLSAADIAIRLNLRTSVIEAIDADNYQDVAHFVFLRGYLRAYADILNLPADDIIKQFDSLNLVESASDRPKRQLVKQPEQPHPRIWRWLSYGLLLLVMVLFIGWWLSEKNLDHQPIAKELLPSMEATQSHRVIHSE